MRRNLVPLLASESSSASLLSAFPISPLLDGSTIPLVGSCKTPFSIAFWILQPALPHCVCSLNPRSAPRAPILSAEWSSHRAAVLSPLLSRTRLRASRRSPAYYAPLFASRSWMRVLCPLFSPNSSLKPGLMYVLSFLSRSRLDAVRTWGSTAPPGFYFLSLDYSSALFFFIV